MQHIFYVLFRLKPTLTVNTKASLGIEVKYG